MKLQQIFTKILSNICYDIIVCDDIFMKIFVLRLWWYYEGGTVYNHVINVVMHVWSIMITARYFSSFFHPIGL